MNFSLRRLRILILIIISAVITYIGFDIFKLTLGVQQYYSGWMLVACIVLLLLYYVKKRLSVIPLGSSSIWAHWHYYLGIISLILFFIHIEFSFPNGVLERILTLTLVIIIISGIVGLFINRLFAWRLAQLHEEVLYERIDIQLKQVEHNAQQLILQCVEKSKSQALADYYIYHLADFFSSPKYFLSHVCGSSYQYQKITNGIQSQYRYLNGGEVNYAVELELMIEKKRIIDTHFALQSVLKYWGNIHAPMAIILIATTILHIILVYAFRGAA